MGTPGAAVAHCGHRSPLQCSLHQEENTAQVDADAKPPFADVSTQSHALDIWNCCPLLAVPSVEEHERLRGQVRVYMDAVRPDMERTVNAFGLSVK